MSKKVKDLHWKPVALEGFPVSNPDFQGFIGLEECTDYGLDKESKKPKKKKTQKLSKDPHALAPGNNKTKQNQKRKSPSEFESKLPLKRVKLSNGFVVESCTNSVEPSHSNCMAELNNKKQGKKNKRKLKTEEIINCVSTNSAETSEEPQLSAEDMLAWAEFKLPEPILRALTELGFKTPTLIQQLTLPAAIHGRRDILGAAETGSGKTLAFGLPILTGILKLKEEAAARGVHVYDIPYKKSSAKKKKFQEEELSQKLKKDKNRNHSKDKIKQVTKPSNKKIIDKNAKESSEDGYSSGDNNSAESDTETQTKQFYKKINPTKNNAKSTDDDDFIEENEVPLRKREDKNSADEGNDSDDDNYLHLSEISDLDDPANESDQDTSGDEESNEDESENDVSEKDELGSDADETDGDMEENLGVEESDEEDVILGGDDEGDVVFGDNGSNKPETPAGVGCVRVEEGVGEPGLEERPARPLYALVLTPTRELAQQVARHLAAAARHTGLRVALLVGGLAAVKQERVLRAGPELVVATPGRLWELAQQGHPHLQRLHAVRFLAIDETDRMLERGHFEELHALLERLNAAGATHQRQTFVFSATLTLVHDLPVHMRAKKVTKRGKIINRKIEKMTGAQKIKRLVSLVGMESPKVVDVTAAGHGAPAALTESRITCARDDKDVYLYYILRHHPARTIVFCNSIGSVRRLATLLGLLQVQVLPLHAAMPQRQRLKNLERFRESPAGVLVATDVAARGLDIPGVEHVLQYHVPRTAESYVHRSGRTARALREGLNVLLVEPGEAHLYSKLCRTLHKEGEVPVFPVAGGAVSALRAAVSAARALDALELRRRRGRQAAGWRERAATEMDIIIDERDLPVPAVQSGLEREVVLRRRALAALLARPVFPRGFSFKYPHTNPPADLPSTAAPPTALQVMKDSLQSGKLKKERRTSKNAPFLKLAQGTTNKKGKNKKFKHKRNTNTFVN